ncbi:MAG: DegT/DnrJ/EryC1/StrS family aminotransferase [Candidatus Aminicenantales bacterium]
MNNSRYEVIFSEARSQVEKRSDIINHFREARIGVNVHIITIYKQPSSKNLGYPDDLCPNTERYYQLSITLPLYPKIYDLEVENVFEKFTIIIKDAEA